MAMDDFHSKMDGQGAFLLTSIFGHFIYIVSYFIALSQVKFFIDICFQLIALVKVSHPRIFLFSHQLNEVFFIIMLC